jgi:hypothetical protein
VARVVEIHRKAGAAQEMLSPGPWAGADIAAVRSRDCCLDSYSVPTGDALKPSVGQLGILASIRVEHTGLGQIERVGQWSEGQCRRGDSMPRSRGLPSVVLAVTTPRSRSTC